MAGIGAALSAGSSILGGIVGGKGAASAAKAQAKAQQAQLQLAQNEFNTISGDASPNINAGNGAVQQMLRLLGLGDSNTGTSPFTAAQQQQGAIDAIKQGPEYQSEFSSGLDALNQSLAASGGLRGGNGALDQSSFGSNLLNSLIQQSIGNLGTVAGLGNSALGTLSGAGANFVNASGQANTALGNANAVQAASPYLAFQQALGGLGSSGLFSSSGVPNFSLNTGMVNSAVNALPGLPSGGLPF